MRLRIKEIMQEKGVTSVELARELGMSKPTISYMINGKTMPSVETLGKVASILGVRIGEIFEEPTNYLNEPSQQLTCPHCGKPLRVEIK